jgi:hypothetical protein
MVEELGYTWAWLYEWFKSWTSARNLPIPRIALCPERSSLKWRRDDEPLGLVS